MQSCFSQSKHNIFHILNLCSVHLTVTKQVLVNYLIRPLNKAPSSLSDSFVKKSYDQFSELAEKITSGQFNFRRKGRRYHNQPHIAPMSSMSSQQSRFRRADSLHVCAPAEPIFRCKIRKFQRWLRGCFDFWNLTKMNRLSKNVLDSLAKNYHFGLIFWQSYGIFWDYSMR